ncbi:MAG: TonB-dependent receptor, partial [Caulobacterales bacterium]|nr:TonB-dependent receptor [Caulobacterales bacterium]
RFLLPEDDDIPGLSFVEIGGRYYNDFLTASATFFRTTFDDLNVGSEPDATGVGIPVIADTEGIGVEWDVTFEPVPMFSLETTGVYQDAEITGIPSGSTFDFLDGNSVTRTPEFQIRVIPTAHLRPMDRPTDVFLIFHHVGERFADLDNSLPLPSYNTIDAGALIDLNDSIQIQLKGTNLTNAIGLTEGNPRSGVSEATASDFYYARPILGRSFLASLTYRF